MLIKGTIPEGPNGAIRLDAVTVELPAGVANLTAGLADVDRNTLTLQSYICSQSLCQNLT